MARFVRAAGVFAFLAVMANQAPAAGQKDIDAAIAKGATYLKGSMKQPGGGVGVNNYGIGPAALAGVALLEAKVPADDPTVKAIVAAVREAAYLEGKTYQLALCIIFLDRLEDPADEPLIQALAVRLLVGQNGQGGWGYSCVDGVPPEHAQWLKTNLKVEQLVAGKEPAKGPAVPKALAKMHPDVLKYAATLQKTGQMGDDNSNTQFAILACWLVRKHGVPVEAALDLIDKRFRATQDGQTGGWGYMGPVPGNAPGIVVMSSASMTCCGLLGLATGTARREEKKPKADVSKDPPAKTPKVDDPFFTPTKPEKPVEAKRPVARDAAAQRAIDALGTVLGGYVQNGGVFAPVEQHGVRDLYFLWSLERVGVIYNIEKFGNVDWYEVGSDALLKAQKQDGSWSGPSYGSDVNTSFALLFLCKADLARDLSSKFRNGKDNELRAGTSGGTPAAGSGDPTTAPMPKTPGTGAGTSPLPKPIEDEASKLASQLLLAPATDWTKSLEKIRDAKGADYTKGLVIAIHRLEGERKKEAREALAERLTRMSAETLKAMTTADDAEMRRGAVLACAMKDDKVHVPDLIDRLTDDDEIVIRAAKAGLKSLTSQDFGPKAGATKEECKAAATAWRAWWAKQK